MALGLLGIKLAKKPKKTIKSGCIQKKNLLTFVRKSVLRNVKSIRIGLEKVIRKNLKI